MRPEDREWRDALGIISDRGSPAPGISEEVATSGKRDQQEEEEDCDPQALNT